MKTKILCYTIVCALFINAGYEWVMKGDYFAFITYAILFASMFIYSLSYKEKT